MTSFYEEITEFLTIEEREFLDNVAAKHGGLPNMTQLWKLMDDAWDKYECNPNVMDDRINKFYKDPVWLLNGIFSEKDPQSLKNREMFCEWISNQKPTRIADFGGGYGALARMVGKKLPNVNVDVIDPHPHSAAEKLASKTNNVTFKGELFGVYDIIIATDVFEHVPDPIGLTVETSNFLKKDGQYLIANCFRPVIKCHLPQLFHLDFAWDSVMDSLGLTPAEHVSYGRSYVKKGAHLNIDLARVKGECGRKIYNKIKWLPKKKPIGKILMNTLCR